MRSPLTYGQLSVIRALQRLPTETWPQTYLTTIVQVPEVRSVPDVITALEAICQRHESLRTHFVGTRDVPAAATMPAGKLDLEIVDLPDCDETAVQAVAHQRSARRFDWEEEFAWRSTIITDGRRPTQVAIVVDHLTADRWGLRRLGAELCALLGEPDDDGARWIAETPAQPGELAQVQRGVDWRARRLAADRYWDRLLHELPSASFPWPTVQGNGRRAEAVLCSSRARFFLGRAARHLDASPQSILLALTAVAAATAFDLDVIVLTLQASNRFERRWRDIVTSMNQGVPLPVAVGDGSASFAAFTERVHRASLYAYRHGSYDIDLMHRKVREARGMSVSFDCYFNFMAHDVVPHDIEPSAGLAPSRRLPTRPRRQAGPRFDVKVRGGADMPLVIRSDPEVLDENRLAHLLAWFEDEIVRLGSGNHVAVADVRARCAQL